jgi:hypothetical protein
MKHPPFNPGPVSGREDYSTEQGARRLGHMIAEQWRKIGVEVPFTVQGVSIGKDGRFASFGVVLPTLVNGLPRR